MTQTYWTVSVKPSVSSLTCFGAGVIVFDSETHQLRHHVVTTKENHLLRGLSSIEHVRDFVSSLDTLVAEQPTLDLSTHFDIPARISQTSRDWANEIVIDPPRLIEMANVDAALAFLTNLYLDIELPKSKPSSLSALQSSIHAAYRKSPRVAELVQPHPRLFTRDNGGSKKIDLAVANESHVFELSETFNFQSTNRERLQDSVDAWTLHIGRLRNDGARLSTTTDLALEVGSATDIAAFYVPPLTLEQHDVFEAAESTWSELEIHMIPQQEVQAHATMLAHKVVA